MNNKNAFANVNVRNTHITGRTWNWEVMEIVYDFLKFIASPDIRKCII